MIDVDVFVPCYNYGRFLASCIRSALLQEGCRVRVLVIDDTSTDDSLAEAYRIAATDPRVKVLAHQTNKGHIATYNDGIAWATADYLTLVSADDLLAPMALARAIAVMEANSRVGFVIGRLLNFADEPDLVGEVATAQGASARAIIYAGTDFIRDICKRGENPVAASGVVVRTALQRKVGGYLPELPHAGDLEMWLRLAAHADLGILDAVQSFTRIHAHNMRHDYCADRMIGDYSQRHLAFEMFFARQAPFLSDAAELARLARRSLADEVLLAADRCFDKADEPAAAQFAKLARTIDRSIVRRPFWWKAAAKRGLGWPLCQTIAPMLTAVRSAGPALRGRVTS